MGWSQGAHRGPPRGAGNQGRRPRGGGTRGDSGDSRGGGQVTLPRPQYTQIDPSDRPCRRRWVGLLTPYPLGVGVLRPRRFTP